MRKSLIVSTLIILLLLSGCTRPAAETRLLPPTVNTTPVLDPVETSPPPESTPSIPPSTTPVPAPSIVVTPTPAPDTSPILKQSETIKIEASPDDGFHWAYYLHIPSSIYLASDKKQKTFLMIEPNNTGQPNDDVKVHDTAARELVQRRSSFASELGVALLVPTFPRPSPMNMATPAYIHALDKNTLITSENKLERIDLQLIAMVDDAIERLSEKGLEVEEKVLMNGFSASGMFTSRFAILHPEKVQAAAIGSPGGWPVVPVGQWQGENLSYPVGVSDITQLIDKEFDLVTFQHVPLFLYLGAEDTNDAVPGPFGYTPMQRQQINSLFGNTPVERWPIAEEIYTSVECNTRFVLYPDAGHILINEMWRDIQEFFHAHMEVE
jgi:hypothetical protein